MFRLVLTCAGLSTACVIPAEPSKAEVKKLAIAVGEATMKNDMKAMVDLVHPSFVELLGGREPAQRAMEQKWKQLKAAGIELKKYDVGEPGEFVTEGGNTFVVVPTVVDVKAPDGVYRDHTSLVGISSDGGKTWKFMDGGGIQKTAKLTDKLPKLPAKLKLPPDVQPEKIKE